MDNVKLTVVKKTKTHCLQDDVLFSRFSSSPGQTVRGDVSNPLLCRQLFTTSFTLLPEQVLKGLLWLRGYTQCHF